MKKRSFQGSPFVRVQAETRQSYELRRPLIRQIEKAFDARVITFFTSFFKGDAYIEDQDAEVMESILAAEHTEGKLVLLLNSAGGFAMAAERIANLCRAYSGNNYDVVIPHMAKSAATMICFGAAAIHMSKTAELGPVDPQISYQDDRGLIQRISAEEYVRSYDKIIDRASSGKSKNIQPFLQQLTKYDAREIESLISAQKLSADISVKLLKSGMMASDTEDAIRKKIKIFLSQPETSAHGRMINFDGARACGLNVKVIDLHSATWDTIWELYVRSNWAVSHAPAAKIIESSTSAIMA